jgi:hypothetical protein
MMNHGTLFSDFSISGSVVQPRGSSSGFVKILALFGVILVPLLAYGFRKK